MTWKFDSPFGAAVSTSLADEIRRRILSLGLTGDEMRWWDATTCRVEQLERLLAATTEINARKKTDER